MAIVNLLASSTSSTSSLLIDTRTTFGGEIPDVTQVPDVNDFINGTSLADTIDGGLGDDLIFGGFGDDVLLGGDGKDFLDGGFGSDQLSGGAGADTLAGGRGIDTLSGGSGRDILVGGGQRDVLTGGGDADVFRFNSVFDSLRGPDSRDVITDFEFGKDIIHLDSIDADVHTDGDQDFTFIGSKAFQLGVAGQIRVAGPEGIDFGAPRIVQIDTDGNGFANMEIVVLGNVGLGSFDF